MACPSGWTSLGSCNDSYTCSSSSCDHPYYVNYKITYQVKWDRCQSDGETKCYYGSSVFFDCECRS